MSSSLILGLPSSSPLIVHCRMQASSIFSHSLRYLATWYHLVRSNPFWEVLRKVFNLNTIRLPSVFITTLGQMLTRPSEAHASGFQPFPRFGTYSSAFQAVGQLLPAILGRGPYRVLLSVRYFHFTKFLIKEIKLLTRAF